jgi:predicted amidohydrolase YtcJ
LRDKLGEVAQDKAVENARLLMLDLNKMGITAFQDQGGTGMKASHIQAFRMARDAGQMTGAGFVQSGAPIISSKASPPKRAQG